ncbi:hypothetical protein ACJJTC_016524 [Scirpophaga incertulas]
MAYNEGIQGENAFLTPPEIIAEAQNASEGLLPSKSKDKYLAAYERFIAWKISKNAHSFSENVALIFGVTGACRRHELNDITTQDVEIRSEFVIVNIVNTKNKIPGRLLYMALFLN